MVMDTERLNGRNRKVSSSLLHLWSLGTWQHFQKETLLQILTSLRVSEELLDAEDCCNIQDNVVEPIRISR
jgi:hypothetical protein